MSNLDYEDLPQPDSNQELQYKTSIEFNKGLDCSTASNMEHKLAILNMDNANTRDKNRNVYLEGTCVHHQTNYHLPVDENQDFKATKLKLLSFQRPHMRAFHYAWWSFFCAFFVWFALAPLLPEIQHSLQLDDGQIWVTNIVSVSSAFLSRFLVGPFCDKYGARIPMGILLMLIAIPTAFTGLVNSYAGLIVLRFFVGIAGCGFVMCSLWTTSMFSKEIVGTVNSFAAGWGNLGGGMAQVVMGSLLFPLFRDVVYQGNSIDDATDSAWRVIFIFPAIVVFATGLVIIFTSDDRPEGNLTELKKMGRIMNISATASFRESGFDWNTWILSIQYGACFGVELTMNNNAATHFVNTFGLNIEAAAAIASLFGFMNIFARGLGGYTSDKMNEKMRMKGRIFVHMFFLICEGICVFLFAAVKDNLWLAILILAIFSIFVQGAEGTTYSIVPYVSRSSGSVSGIVGAGGPAGAIVFGFGFLYIAKIQHAYYLMGSFVVLSSCLCLLLNIRGHGGLFSKSGPSRHEMTLVVPDPPANLDISAGSIPLATVQEGFEDSASSKIGSLPQEPKDDEKGSVRDSEAENHHEIQASEDVADDQCHDRLQNPPDEIDIESMQPNHTSQDHYNLNLGDETEEQHQYSSNPDNESERESKQASFLPQ
mmetsp:Transcript_12350/g.18979  ORF Transcript_12350/g.18979 Transcript_12350/m.18979 type:complete len:652 (+) Transcript_12350:218-2173(+)